MKTALLVITALVLACSTCHAVPITLFADIDTYLKRSEDIVIAKCVSIPEQGTETFDDGLFPVQVEIVSIVKGEKTPGRLTVATIYDMQPGTNYLLASSGGKVFDTDFLALPELSVIPIPANFDLDQLKGKQAKQQVHLILARHLFETEQKLAPLRHLEGLLKKALQDRRDHLFESAGTVQLREIRGASTQEGNVGICLKLPPGRLEWSHAQPGKSGYFYFNTHGEKLNWEFAASEQRNLDEFNGKPLLSKFYGQFSPSLDPRLGHQSSNAIQVEVGQIVLARTAQDPHTVYVLKLEKQEQTEALTVQYAVVKGE